MAPAAPAGIPRLVHFVYGLATDPGDREFAYEHYLAVLAAATHIRPDAIHFHHHHVPTGEWWERSAPLLTLRQIELPTEISGHPLSHAAHRADVVRLRVLLREGGIYLDMDVIALRSFDELLGSALPALGMEGKQGEHGLCNAVIVSPAGAPFLQRWLDAYDSFDEAQWAEHSVRLPMRLARAHGAEVRALPANAFFWPLWDDAALKRLLLYAEYDFTPNFAAHLWSQIAGPYVLSAWSPALVAALPSGLNCRLRALPGALDALGGGGGRVRPPPTCACDGSVAPIDDGARGGAGDPRPRAPTAHWPLDRGGNADADSGADAAGDAPGGLGACAVRDTRGGCSSGFLFAHGCGARDGVPPPHPYAEGPLGVRALSYARADAVEVLVGLQSDRARDFSLTWWAAARGDGHGARSLDGLMWWSLVFEGGGQLVAGLERARRGHLAPSVRLRAPRPPVGRSCVAAGGWRASLNVADGAWHEYALHARAGRLVLRIDGLDVAGGPWWPPSERIVAAWLGTAEPEVAARARPHVRGPGADATDALTHLAHVRFYAPALAIDEPLAGPPEQLVGYSPPPLVASPAAALHARASHGVRCVAGEWVAAAPMVSVALALAAACALLRLAARRSGMCRGRRRGCDSPRVLSAVKVN